MYRYFTVLGSLRLWFCRGFTVFARTEAILICSIERLLHSILLSELDIGELLLPVALLVNFCWARVLLWYTLVSGTRIKRVSRLSLVLCEENVQITSTKFQSHKNLKELSPIHEKNAKEVSNFL